MISRADAIQIWRRAQNEEIGVAITNQSADLRQVQNLLYEVRAEMNDPALSNISLFLPGDKAKGEMWLVKQEVELD